MSLNTIKTFILDLIFPRYCLGCRKEMASKQSVLVCDACFGKITLNSGVQCHICGLRNRFGTCPVRNRVSNGTCRKCQKKTPLRGLFAASQYKNPILKEMIHQFKYQSVESLKKPLAELIIAYITKELLTNKLTNSVLVPIPLTLKRKINRGFNQSELLAKEIGKFLNCPVINLLKRKKFTSPQAEISDWQQRKENIANAFCLSTSYPHFYRFRKPIKIKVILVDDVSTSGATLEEAATVL
ncbi:MAG: double zinc ribbon domain-containing protein, partial [Candidatus Azambacteria bacterium]|nr:double zinc ribbon domain-containing protein [Candidatus Azambacteria bacterium]